VSTVASIQRLPRAAHTGRVTQLRVVLSEWTKLHSLRSTRWSLLAGPEITVEALEPGYLEAHGLTAAQIGDVAAANGIALHELTPQQASLEEAFMDLTREEIEFKAAELVSEEAVA